MSRKRVTYTGRVVRADMPTGISPNGWQLRATHVTLRTEVGDITFAASGPRKTLAHDRYGRGVVDCNLLFASVGDIITVSGLPAGRGRLERVKRVGE